MNTNDILTILKVCETGSINKAAGQLFMTPQAVSVVIKRMENELGVELFRRTPSGMVMNECGEAFYRKSRNLITDLEELEELFHLDPSNKHGVLRVGFSQGIIVKLGVRYILNFTKLYPNFRIEIIEGPDKKVEELVSNGTVDIGVTVAPLFANTFQMMPWCKYKCCVLFSSEYKDSSLLKPHGEVSCAELKDLPIVLENKDFSIYNEFERICMEDYAFTPEIFFETVEIENALAIASGGAAVAVVPQPVAQDAMYDNLHVAQIKEDLFWEWCFIKNKDSHITKVEQDFIDYLKARTDK